MKNNMTTLTLAKLNRHIAKKYPDLKLVRDSKGYYYLVSDTNDELGLKLAGLESASIYIYSVKQYPLERWLEDVDSIMSKIDYAPNLKAKFGIFTLTSGWSDSKDGLASGRYGGHFTVYLHMGGADLKWDIKKEDFTSVKEVLTTKNIPHSGIVNCGFGSHNSMTFQYVRKSQRVDLFEAIKEVLTKRLVKA